MTTANRAKHPREAPSAVPQATIVPPPNLILDPMDEAILTALDTIESSQEKLAEQQEELLDRVEDLAAKMEDIAYDLRYPGAGE